MVLLLGLFWFWLCVLEAKLESTQEQPKMPIEEMITKWRKFLNLPASKQIDQLRESEFSNVAFANDMVVCLPALHHSEDSEANAITWSLLQIIDAYSRVYAPDKSKGMW